MPFVPTRLALAVLFLHVATPQLANASCARGEDFFSPPSGEALPPKATVWFFAYEPLVLRFDSGAWFPEASPPVVSATDEEGKPVPVEVELVSWTPVAFVSRVTFVRASGRVTLVAKRQVEWNESLRAMETARAEYVIDQRWRAPKLKLTTPKRTTTRMKWMCSSQDTANLEGLPPAPAYRFEWTAAGETGPKRSLIFPTGLGQLFDRRKTVKRDTGEIELGHVNCTGLTFPWFEAAIDARVVALLANGTEQSIHKGVLRIERPVDEPLYKPDEPRPFDDLGPFPFGGK